MRAVKSKARNQITTLTVTKATSQARRHVDKLMPGVGATVDSRGSWDMESDRQVIITTITFPASQLAADLLTIELLALPGQIGMRSTPESITITRTV